ncbi:hypothetical protein G6F46_014338 [Rhizopus delemar]|nr:hypothetical protein G6F46_014338 [Rhizopus delemar]
MPLIASRARAFIAYQRARKIFIVCSFIEWVLPGWAQRAASHGAPVANPEQRPDTRANGRRRGTVPATSRVHIHLDEAIYLPAPAAAARAMTAISFEFYPPKTAEQRSQLDRAADKLKDYGPEYVSCTFGAAPWLRSGPPPGLRWRHPPGNP